MGGAIIVVLTAALAAVGLGGLVFAFSAPSGSAKKRVAALARSPAAQAQVRTAALTNQQRRKSVQQLLKDIERQQSEQKQRPTLQRRLARAGLQMSPRTFWILSGIAALLAGAACLFTRQPILVAVLVSFAIGLGFPRWALWFLTKRRQKKFTSEFANGIDVIVRSVKSGLPTNEALKIVAREIPEPVAGEFNRLCEGLKVGVALDQGLKRMYDNMPTPEVNFFGIVMTVQLKSGGNLSEALGNLSSVLRERKRLQGKIKALSAEAKASALIIGALPPGVATMVYFTTPSYIEPLFNTRVGNLMLIGCAIWMSLGVLIMKKMISFKH
ncbi:MAG TPA: type II secretion system F family protein [Rhizomicrobium sp.]|nr:type II secretion system F family protein [Rhizomicrobium sp.]